MSGGGKNQPIQPTIAQPIPQEFLPFARDLAGMLGGRLNQPTVNPFQQGILNAFFGSPSTAMSVPRPLPSPGTQFGIRPPGIGINPPRAIGGMRPGTSFGIGLPFGESDRLGFPIRAMEGIEPPRPEPPIGGGPPPIPSPTPGLPLPGGTIMPPLGPQVPSQAVPLGGAFGQGLGFLGGALGGQTNPLLQQGGGVLSGLLSGQTTPLLQQAGGAASSLLSGQTNQPLFPEAQQTLRNILGGNVSQPGLAQTQAFLGGLMSGQVPESLRAASAENLARSQAALNAQLQQRGGFFGSHGAQLQSDLARQSTQDLNNLVFQNAMSAAPLAANLSQLPFQQQMAALPGALQASQIPTQNMLAALPAASQLGQIPFQQQMSALPLAGQFGQIPFQQQMSALQGMLPLFSGAAGLAQMPNQLPEATGPGINLLGALRGTPMQPQFAPDPWAQLIGLIGGLFL